MSTLPNPTYAPHFPMVEAHEDRIQVLEQNFSDVRAELATHTVKLSELSLKLDDSVSQIQSTIQNCVAPVAAKLGEHIAECKEEKKEIKSHDGRLEHLEQDLKKRKVRWTSLKKYVLPLLLTSAGVIATKLGEVLWGMFSK
jgi:chromosome segregation ATPase